MPTQRPPVPIGVLPCASSQATHSSAERSARHRRAGETAVTLADIVSELSPAERAVLRSCADKALIRVEIDRGGSYSQAVRWKKLQAATDRALAIVRRYVAAAIRKVAADLRPPTRPSRQIKKFALAEETHAYLVARLRIDRDDGVPEKPPSIGRYERACKRVAVTIRKRALAVGCYWLRTEVLDRVEAKLVEEFGRSARTACASRAAARRSTRPAEFPKLVGDDAAFPLERSSPRAEISKSEARRLAQPLRLTFLEDLRLDGVDRAVRERHAESDTHRTLVGSMVGLLCRLGHAVYPGGVGVEGTFAMADLLAFAESGPLFVECLTKKGIAKFGSHLRKRDLALQVPVCLVGPIPDDFMATLPSTAYGIPHPNAPVMLNGEWVPRFYRRGGAFRPHFVGTVQQGRTMRRVTITLPGLRLEEDVSGFLWVALAHAMFGHRGRADARANGWIIRKVPQAPIGLVPFTRHGMPGSSLAIEREDSSLLLRLGSVPVVAELRGSDSALRLICSWLQTAGLPLNLS